MALAKYGGGVVQLSGSIAGNVFFRNRFGNCVRPRTKPVNPHSDRQEAIRAELSYLAEYWHSDLDDTQRGLWGVYAAAVAIKNRLGETIHHTGFNHFIRTNCAKLHIGAPLEPDAPTILSLPEKTTSCSAPDQTSKTRRSPSPATQLAGLPTPIRKMRSFCTRDSRNWHRETSSQLPGVIWESSTLLRVPSVKQSKTHRSRSP